MTEAINMSALEDLLESNNRFLLDAIYALLDASADTGKVDRSRSDYDAASVTTAKAPRSKRNPAGAPSKSRDEEDDREDGKLTNERDAERRGALVLGRKATDPLGMTPPDDGPLTQTTSTVGGLTIPGAQEDARRDRALIAEKHHSLFGLRVPDDDSPTTTPTPREELIEMLAGEDYRARVREMLTTNEIRRDKRLAISGLFLPED